MREKEGQKKAKAPAPLRNKVEFISQQMFEEKYIPIYH